ncbi:hypothetical protein KP509_34G025800 [Ceratopteris richardii]|uniref:RRM domain-containing protein n=2 Tax=Ceratopteris richardii TaxID=49495 RepID=A0A8T2QKQ1_CERRI|nr:hypothetical protein KP509_34G025800 [Ceratopteris richardii]KAH7283831.1 hypothetical protein KP509_34G025800 [Ceratopteris richardii]
MGFSLLPRRAMARRGVILAFQHPQVNSRLSLPHGAFRRSYSSKLFVGGLSFRTDEEAVRRAFSQHGEVVEVKLINDRETGRPKGFGFVTFGSEADAEAARSKMTGQLLDGRIIRVDKATSSRPPLPTTGASGISGGAPSFIPPVSSSLPPIADDWGTIPSNVVELGSSQALNSSPTSTAVSVESNTMFNLDTSNPFDSSTFGQAAASWSASTRAPQSNTGIHSCESSSAGSEGSDTFSLATSYSSITFETSGTSSSSSSFGSAANATGISSSLSPENTNAASTATSTFTSWNKSSPPAASTRISCSPTRGAIGAQSSFTDPSNTSSGRITFDPQPCDRSTSRVASDSANVLSSHISSASTAFNTSSFNISSTSVVTGTSASTSASVSATVNTSSSVNAGSIGSSNSGLNSAVSNNSDSSTPSGTIAEIKSAAIASGPADTSASSSTLASSTSPHPLNSPALTSSGTFDFSNFSFDNSTYRDNDPPLPRRRPRPRSRPATQTISDINSGTSLLETRSPFGSNNQFAETSIPKPKGTEVDFGLLNITAPCPPGMRPQGTFDIYIPDDLPEIPPPEPKPKPKLMSLAMFPHRQLPSLDLPYHTPEADNWSEIGKDPPKYDLSTLFPSMGELIKKEKEFHWDPFDFDPEATLPPPEEVIIIDSDYD